MKLADLDTPNLILDKQRLQANIARISARAKALGVDLRPHMKTAKCAEVAKLATAGHSGGITVSTLKEAEYFADHGFRDITYAVGIAPAKLARAAALRRRGVALSIVTDNIQVAQAIARAPETSDTGFEVMIEVDTGDGRAGVGIESEDLIAIGKILSDAPGVTLRGVLTHMGKSYSCRDIASIVAVAEMERAGAVRAAERLRAERMSCPVVSVGSTPTATHAKNLEGVTEMRPGVFVFQDVFQAEIGSCAMDDIAVSVLATVTGHHPERGEIVIDAGGLALSKDRSTASGPRDVGYGLVVDESCGRGLPEMFVAGVSQEHGIVRAMSGELPYERLMPGTRVRVLPNHACFTAAAYDAYRVVDGSAADKSAVVDTWPRVNGW
jgi:D-serine deaminase-like pyridoxal phosphate-dependent protein